MFKIDVSGEQLGQVQELLKGIEKGAPVAISRALNRTANSAAVQVSKSIKELYFGGQRDIKAQLTIDKATPKDLVAVLSAKGEQLGAEHFKISPSEVTKKRPAVGVRVRLQRASAGHRIPGSFVANLKSGAKVFKSERYISDLLGKRGMPLVKYKLAERIVGLAPAQMMESVLDDARIQQKIDERLDTEIKSQIDFILLEGHANQRKYQRKK